MEKLTILWADDEIHLLKPHIILLEKKGYQVLTVSNGIDAVDEVKAKGKDINLVFLDESMPGLNGLDTLDQIKELAPNLPVVMITKNEEEGVMEQAIGSKISDYLIKPVKPAQLISTILKVVDADRLVREKTSIDYQQEFRNIFNDINNNLDYEAWAQTYRKIIHWELKIDASKAEGMEAILASQKEEANSEFSKFVSQNYLQWLKKPETAPMFSHEVLKSFVFPDLKDELPTFFVLLDNLRYDQWKIIEPIVAEYFQVEEEDYFYSILPTTTQYSRNALFAGLMPSDIEAYFPNWWKNDMEKGGKNLYEKQLLEEQIRRSLRKNIRHEYIKITNTEDGKALVDNIHHYWHNFNFVVIVYNFIDMLSHARTEMEILKELAGDEKAYRSLTRSWFLHSPLWEALKILSEKKIKLFITTDHGTIRVDTPSKVVGDRETTTNLRYKVGKNLQYDRRDVFDVRNPIEGKLPSPNLSSTFIFAKGSRFFLYPNNYSHYNNYYNNTFQHGGISLEEMIVPLVKLRSRG